MTKKIKQESDIFHKPVEGLDYKYVPIKITTKDIIKFFNNSCPNCKSKIDNIIQERSAMSEEEYIIFLHCKCTMTLQLIPEKIIPPLHPALIWLNNTYRTEEETIQCKKGWHMNEYIRCCKITWSKNDQKD